MAMRKSRQESGDARPRHSIALVPNQRAIFWCALVCTVLLLLGFFVSGSVASEAQPASTNLQLLAYISSSSHSIDVQGNFVYVAGGYGFLILDRSQPSELQPVGSYLIEGKYIITVGFAVEQLQVDGAYAYLVDQWGFLRIVDITHPESPNARGVLSIEPGWSLIGTLKMAEPLGPYLFLGSEKGGITVVDASNPQKPVKAATALSQEGVVALVRTGHYLYAVDKADVLHSFDISAPLTPRHLDAYPLPYAIQSMAAGGEYLYIADSSGMLRMIHLSDPSLLHEANHIPLSASAGKMELDETGKRLYIASAGAGLHIFDLSMPLLPVQVGVVPSSGETVDVVARGDVVFLADGPGGVQAVNVSLPDSPTVLSRYQPIGASDITAVGELAYVISSGGLVVLDTRQPSQFRVVGEYRPADRSYSHVTVRDSRAYLISGKDVDIVDISDPSALQRIGSIRSPDNVWDVDASGENVYLIANGGLNIYDTSDPFNAVLLGSLKRPYWASNVAARPGLVYIVEATSILTVVDVSDPTAPQVLGSDDIGSNGASGETDIALQGDFAYLSVGWYGGMAIFDIADAESPRFIKWYYTPTNAANVAVSPPYAAVADWDAGFFFFDVSDPYASKSVGYFNMPGTSRKAAIQGDVFYGIGGGLVILRILDPSLPTPTPFPTATPTATPSPTPHNPGGSGSGTLASTVVLSGGGALQASLAGLTYTVEFAPDSVGEPVHVALLASQTPVNDELVSVGEPIVLTGQDEFGSAVATIQKPFTFTVDYGGVVVPVDDQPHLLVYTWSSASGRWMAIPTQVNLAQRILVSQHSVFEDFIVLIRRPLPVYLPFVRR